LTRLAEGEGELDDMVDEALIEGISEELEACMEDEADDEAGAESDEALGVIDIDAESEGVLRPIEAETEADTLTRGGALLALLLMVLDCIGAADSLIEYDALADCDIDCSVLIEAEDIADDVAEAGAEAEADEAEETEAMVLDAETPLDID